MERALLIAAGLFLLAISASLAFLLWKARRHLVDLQRKLQLCDSPHETYKCPTPRAPLYSDLYEVPNEESKEITYSLGTSGSLEEGPDASMATPVTVTFSGDAGLACRVVLLPGCMDHPATGAGPAHHW